MPSHNRAGLIAQSAASVLRQTFGDLELIVVDDGSTDNTRDVVAALGDSRVRYLKLAANRGASAARNAGIAEARGEFIAFQDSDDEWLPLKLEQQIAALAGAGPGTRAAYCALIKCYARHALLIPSGSPGSPSAGLTESLLRGNFIGTPTLLVSRDVLVEAGGFDESLPRLQDWDLALRLSRLTDFAFVARPLVLAFDTADSISSVPVNLARALVMIVEKFPALFAEAPAIRSSHYLAAGRVYMRLGQVKEGRRALRKALEASPVNWKRWLTFLGAMLPRRGGA